MEVSSNMETIVKTLSSVFPYALAGLLFLGTYVLWRRRS